MIITIEGIDGSGKGTQAKLLAEHMRKSGYDKVELLSFPSYDKTFFGREVGAFLRGEYGTIDQVHPKMASILYACDRFEMAKWMREKIKNGYIIICDRYTDSNIAHQISKLDSKEERDEMKKWLDEMEFEILGIPKPIVTLYLDVPHNVTKKLVLTKDTRDYTNDAEDIHEADYDYLKKTSDIYEELCEERGWTRINCLGENGYIKSVDEIHASIIKNFGMVD